MATDLHKEKEEFQKRHRENLEAIASLKAENVSYDLLRTNKNCIFEFQQEKHKDLLDKTRQENQQALETLEKNMVKHFFE